MSNDNGTIRHVQSVINQAYGDRGTSSLDRVVSANIVSSLRAAGWMSPQEVAILVEAAGGEIIIHEDLLRRLGDFDLIAKHPGNSKDIRTDSLIFTSKEHNPGPKTVESGPIKIKPVKGAKGYVDTNPGSIA